MSPNSCLSTVRLCLVIICGTFFVAANSVSAEPDDTTAAKPAAVTGGAATSDDDYIEMLADAKRLQTKLESATDTDLREALNEAFLKTIRSQFGKFPTVTPVVERSAFKFVRSSLNRHGRGFEGVRFKTPAATKSWDLDWEFVAGEELSGRIGWYIAPAVGAMDGFSNMAQNENFAEEGADLPASNLHISQGLPGGSLKAGAEYLIWFSFPDDKPHDLHIRLLLTPYRPLDSDAPGVDQPRGGPKETAEAFFRAIAEGNAEAAAKRFFSTETQRQIIKPMANLIAATNELEAAMIQQFATATFSTNYQPLVDLRKQYRTLAASVSVAELREEKKSATLIWPGEPQQVRLRQEGGKWKINVSLESSTARIQAMNAVAHKCRQIATDIKSGKIATLEAAIAAQR